MRNDAGVVENHQVLAKNACFAILLISGWMSTALTVPGPNHLFMRDIHATLAGGAAVILFARFLYRLCNNLADRNLTSTTADLLSFVLDRFNNAAFTIVFFSGILRVLFAAPVVEAWGVELYLAVVADPKLAAFFRALHYVSSIALTAGLVVFFYRKLRAIASTSWHRSMLNGHDIEKSSTTAGLPISIGLAPVIERAHVAKHANVLDNRTLLIVFFSFLVAVASTLIARFLVYLIALITNLAFFGHVSTASSSPADNNLGYWVILVPMVGALFVGVMARFGSKAIRGHGIPEAMEQILTNESRIPLRMTFLKPLSAALAIGTGGPFGAEGPIIATGGALGSLLGQLVHVSAQERRTLLASGAAAGMTAIFATPFAAILLAIELLLFEFRPRSFIPVASAALTAMIVRPWLFGSLPLFHVPYLPQPQENVLAYYALAGLTSGLSAVFISKSVYLIEDLFERLPIHWMWWPTIGAFIVGVIGVVSPPTLGIGYENIEMMLNGVFLGRALLFFCVLKFLSWSIALGSGTSGGTLAPLFTIGGGIGALTAQLINSTVPEPIIDLRMMAIVGMASCFAGASRALFASVVFALEITRQFNCLLPLLIGCVVSFSVSALAMKSTIMTEKLVRRGHHVPSEYLGLRNERP